MFEIGESYTRKQIHDQLGCSIQIFLPTVDGEVVCACLSRNKNPNGEGAPRGSVVAPGEWWKKVNQMNPPGYFDSSSLSHNLYHVTSFYRI